MKKLYTTLLVILLAFYFSLSTVTAQSPEKMSYQAVVRDASNNLATVTQVGMQISILQSTAIGTAVYVETQTPTTNANGLVTIEIGTGTVVSGDFSTINWGSDTYFIKTETDLNGGANYTITGTSQLLSVPYALHATTASGVTIYTTAEIAELTPSQGDAVFNSTEKLYQIYESGVWQSFNSNCWPQPTVANAGSDQTFSDGTVAATLAANTPEAGHGIGEWTIVSGTGGSFTDATLPTTTFNGVLHDDYILQWTITTNCSSTADDVVIVFKQDGAGSTLTDADGNTYNTVYIGNQLWMAENLKVTQEAGGTAIPLVTDDTAWGILEDNDTDKAYCYYNNSTDSLAKYGVLYTYAAAKDACPAGWHLSTNAEWEELQLYIAFDGHSGTEGLALKTITGWNSGGNGTDDYGFSALPGGFRSYASDGAFGGVGLYGYWWISSEPNSSTAYNGNLSYLSSYVGNGFGSSKSHGLSVRCLRD